MVVGIQAASSPPRYAPISKVRQIAKTATVEEIEVDEVAGSELSVRKMARPVSAGHAEMIEGEPETVASQIIELIKERGLLP